MQIKVTYSFGHDVGNYFNSIYKFRWFKHGRKRIQEELLKGLPTSFKKSLVNAKKDREAKEAIKGYLLKEFDNRKNLYKSISSKLQDEWSLKKEAIESNLEKVYGKRIPFKTIGIYLTSLPISPYKFPEWILIYAEMPAKRQLEVITHELNHFMFYYYFGSLKEKLGLKKFEMLKEALTVFTNPEEKGYPSEKKLRAWLKEQKGTVTEIIEKDDWRDHL